MGASPLYASLTKEPLPEGHPRALNLRQAGVHVGSRRCGPSSTLRSDLRYPPCPHLRMRKPSPMELEWLLSSHTVTLGFQPRIIGPLCS